LPPRGRSDLLTSDETPRWPHAVLPVVPPLRNHPGAWAGWPSPPVSGARLLAGGGKWLCGAAGICRIGSCNRSGVRDTHACPTALERPERLSLETVTPDVANSVSIDGCGTAHDGDVDRGEWSFVGLDTRPQRCGSTRNRRRLLIRALRSVPSRKCSKCIGWFTTPLTWQLRCITDSGMDGLLNRRHDQGSACPQLERR